MNKDTRAIRTLPAYGRRQVAVAFGAALRAVRKERGVSQDWLFTHGAGSAESDFVHVASLSACAAGYARALCDRDSRAPGRGRRRRTWR